MIKHLLPKVILSTSIKASTRTHSPLLPSSRTHLIRSLALFPTTTYGPASFLQRARTMSTYSVPQEMKCILVKDGKGPADNLYLGSEPVPTPKQGEVLVKIKAFGLNRMDIVQRMGQYPLPPQASKTILGVEFSGVIVDVPEGGKKGWKVGDEVFGLAYGGAYAEYIAVNEQMVVEKPERFSWIEAAGILENWLTAFQALFLEGNMKEGENVLIHAGASGVGVAANQLAVNFKAKNVFTTAGTDEKVEFLKGLCKTKVHPINYKTQDFEQEVKKVTPDGVDVIVDFVGPDYWNQNINVMARDGRMVILAYLSGAKMKDGSLLGPILFKRLTIKGSTLRSRSAEYQGALLQRFKDEAMENLGGEGHGRMKVSIHAVYPWTEVVQAHKDMEANKNSGKIVFEIPE